MTYKIVRVYAVEARSRREASDALRVTDYGETYLEWAAIEPPKELEHHHNWPLILVRKLKQAEKHFEG